MNRKTNLTHVILLSVLFAGTSFGLSDVQYLDFTGWDHNLVTGGGQTFTDIFGEVDVTVSSVGDFDFSTGFAVGWINTGGHQDRGSHTLVFDFSSPLRLVVKSNTVDPDENLKIVGSASKSYFLSRGAMPNLTNSGNEFIINGNGFGMDPVTGSSQGETLLGGDLSSIRVTHQSLSLTSPKFERIMVGTLVPEPNSCGLLFIGLLGMIQRFRRRG